MHKKVKTQEKYKQLLITHYGFKEVDFYKDEETIYCCSKDNVGLTPRDIYEEFVYESIKEMYYKQEYQCIPMYSEDGFESELYNK